MLHQIVNPETDGQVVEQHVLDHFVQVETEIIFLHTECSEFFLELLKLFVTLSDQLFSACSAVIFSCSVFETCFTDNSEMLIQSFDHVFDIVWIAVHVKFNFIVLVG